jgi:hypothetical protein
VEGRCKYVGRGLEGMGKWLEYVKGFTLHKGNEEGMEVGGTLTKSERFWRSKLRGVKTCVEVIIRGGAYGGMRERVVDIIIEGSTVLERVYLKSWAYSIEGLTWLLIRWDITHKIEMLGGQEIALVNP